MFNTKALTRAAILTGIVIVLEVFVAKTGEFFTFLTIFSALPLYMISRSQFSLGMISYGVIDFILFTVSPHQMFFFMFTNGIVGLSLGGVARSLKQRYKRVVICGILLALGLQAITSIIGIPLPLWGGTLGKLLVFYSFACLYIGGIDYLFEKTQVYLEGIIKE